MAHLCKVCVTVVAQSVDEMIHDIYQAKAGGADLVELRLDHIQEFNPHSDLPRLLSGRVLPAIVTYRPSWEGGRYAGDETLRLRALDLAVSLGADYVDVELQCASAFIAAQRYKTSQSNTEFMVSSHDFNSTPSEEELGNLYARIVETGADIVKLVTTAQDITDVARVLSLQSRSPIPTTTSVLGSKGIISRILAPKFGSFITFPTLAGATVDEQVTLTDLVETYRVKDITVDTKVFGVIGKKVSHSKGPWLHNPAFLEKRFNAVYVPLSVDNLSAFFKAFDSPDFRGFSISIPYKEEALGCCDAVDGRSRNIGAVNTLVRRRDGRLVGFNTDSDAAVTAIEDGLRSSGVKSPGNSPLLGMTVVLIGAGGAGRAVAFGAKARGASLVITNRNYVRAQELAAACGAIAVPFSELKNVPTSPGMVLANTSSLGMHPNVGDSPVADKETLKKYALVFDAVYNPAETRLMREAREFGITVVGGIEMFIRQAVAQYELFTEGPAPKEVMRRTAESFG